MTIVYNGTNANNRLVATDLFPFDETIHMFGFGGADELKGAFLHTNYIWGGEGNDVLTGGAARSSYLYGEAGNDQLVSLSNVDPSELRGGIGNDVLRGGGGGNLLDGGAGVDTMWGGDGADVYIVNTTLDQIFEGYTPYYDNDPNPRDKVRAYVSWTLGANLEDLLLLGALASAGTGNGLSNVLTGNAAANILSGVGGSDSLIGAGGNDRLLGGLGNDGLDGGQGGDRLEGGIGNDRYFVDNVGDLVVEAAGAGIDTVTTTITLGLGANLENLTLIGAATRGTGNALGNVLRGNAASNVLNGGSGADAMLGGLGNDRYQIDNLNDSVTEAAGQGIDTVVATISHALALNVENLTLAGVAAINGTGNALANTLRGNAGGNVVNGVGGADQMFGSLGNDTYIVDNSGDVVVEAFGLGIDSVQSLMTYALTGNVENLTLIGSAAINGSGNALNNTLRGNATGNALVGGLGADLLLGDAGRDVLVGALGRDVSVGGVGADSFVFRTAGEAGLGAARDVIQDLAAGIDKIVLAAIDANLLQDGNQAFVFVGSNTFSGTAAELRFTGGLAAADLNGDGLADLEITVQNVAQLAATDFVL